MNGRRDGAATRGFCLILWAAVAIVGCQAGPAVEPVGEANAAVFRRAAVAADHPVASAAGAEILRRGGNAVDAAVATSFCLSVVRPESCGIGGGGFMVIHMPPVRPGQRPRRIAVDYRETAPRWADADAFIRLDDPLASRFGPRAVGVPGTVAGLLAVLERYGTMSRAVVLAPAIRAAEEGFAVDAHLVAALEAVRERLDDVPARRAYAAGLLRAFEPIQEPASGEEEDGDDEDDDDGLRPGDRVRNPAQARALRLIAASGADAFYRGPIADAVMAVLGGAEGPGDALPDGPITAADLTDYRPSFVEPLAGRWGSYEVLTMPPPSSGGIALLQMLGILARHGYAPGGDAPARGDDPAYVHVLVEAMKHAFADRATWLGDPRYTDVPVDDLLAPGYLDALASAVDPARTMPAPAYGSAAVPAEDGGTSHLSVLDAHGMAVACTETINLRFGSLVWVEEYGFALNDQMDDFTTDPDRPNVFGLRQSARNAPAPGKRPLSSMTPTIVTRDGAVVVVAGASGGPRIINGTLQCVLNVLLLEQPVGDAVEAPRVHHQWMPDRVDLEARWSNAETEADLAARGHDVGRRPDVGHAQLVVVTEDGVTAASDSRKGGTPAGY